MNIIRILTLLAACSCGVFGLFALICVQSDNGSNESYIGGIFGMVFATAALASGIAAIVLAIAQHIQWR